MKFPVVVRSLADWLGNAGHSSARAPRRSYQPRLETLESRQLLSISIIDLGTLPGGSFTKAMAVNSMGHVVGFGDVAGGEIHGFLWRDGVMTDLGSMGGPNSGPYDINDLDQVVGDVQMPDGSTHAFLWQDGVMTDLHVGEDGPGGRTSAWGINNNGAIVGATIKPNDPTKEPRAYLWQNGVITYLDSTLGGEASYAYDITDGGDICGFAEDGNGNYLPFFADDVTNNPIRMVYIGTLGGDRGRAYRLNDHGQIIGAASEGGRYDKSFLYDYNAGGIFGLGTLGGAFSYAWDINEAGIVVGTSFMTPPGIHAYVDINFQMTDLNSLLPDQYWTTLIEARGINDSNQIIGHGYHDHQVHAYLMNFDTGSLPVADISTLVAAQSVPSSASISSVDAAAAGTATLSNEVVVDATAAGLVAANADGTPAIVPAPADVPVSDGVSSLLGADPALGTSP
jgi:probable HAF family extracellular repeat protein